MSNPVLKSTIKSTIHVKAEDLERFIYDVLGREIEIACDMELCSRNWVVNVSKSCVVADGRLNYTGEMGEYYSDMLNTWIKTGKGTFMTKLILEHLCNNDLIIAGEYIVDLS